MILRLLALVALPFMAYYMAKSIGKRFALTPRQNRFLFFITAALLVIGVLVVMGRLPIQFILAPMGAAAAFALRMLPTLLRLLPIWQMIKSRTASANPRDQGQTSTIRTDFLEMELKHSSGDMDGLVLKGRHARKQLSSLSLEELITLHAECGSDADSRQVLEAYIDRNHADWREQTEQAEAQHEIVDESVMTRDLALEILGLGDSITKEKVIKTHRNLMQKMHPDRGGSDYLAKKINAAKEFLMECL